MAREEPLTPEEFHKIGDEAYEMGLEELGDMFHHTADIFAVWNEHHARTVEEIRQKLGDDVFFGILKASLGVD